MKTKRFYLNILIHSPFYFRLTLKQRKTALKELIESCTNNNNNNNNN